MAYTPPSAEKLAQLMGYMKLDPADVQEQATVLRCHAAAYAFLMAGRSVPEEYAALADLALDSLTLHYYDHRDDTDPNAAPLPVGLLPIVSQLKAVSNLGG